MEYYLQLIINGLVVGSIYSLVALGFVIIYKATKVVNFAQGELVLVGENDECLLPMARTGTREQALLGLRYASDLLEG